MRFWYPSEGSENDPAWWLDLERVAELTRRSDSLPTIAACEFMFMGRMEQRRRRIWLYKHIATRRYLNLDDEGHAYSYLEPADLPKDGRYVAHHRLADALVHLELELVSTKCRYERCRDCQQCAESVFLHSKDGDLVF